MYRLDIDTAEPGGRGGLARGAWSRRLRRLMVAILPVLITWTVAAGAAGAGDHARLREDAAAGDREAQYTLAHLHLKGRGGLPCNPEAAQQWFARAAANGHPDAAFDLAAAYLEGRYLEKDPRRGRYWVEWAAEAGHLQAQYLLGMAYLETDAVQAAAWLRKADQGGLAEAGTELAKLCRTVPAACD